METNNNKIKTVRVSRKTDPKQLAISLIYSLDQGLTVKAYSIVEASKILCKALAMMNLFQQGKNIKYDFQPTLEYMKDDTGTIKNVLCWTINMY